MTIRNIKSNSKKNVSRPWNLTPIIIAIIGAAAVIIAAIIGISKNSNLVSMIVAPEKATIPVGSSIQLEAVGLTEEKINILDIKPEWSLNNPEVGTLNDNRGRITTFRAIKEGKTDAKAKIGSIQAVAQIEVIEKTGKDIFKGTALTTGYNMGVNTSEGRTDWLIDSKKGFMRMDYPEGQRWGAVFITVGEPQSKVSERKTEDLSKFKYLTVDLKGEVAGESVEIGLKDNTDPDDGRETKIKISDLTTEWKTYKFELKNFETADLSRLYVVIEFVFTGENARTVYFRNIRYVP